MKLCSCLPSTTPVSWLFAGFPSRLKESEPMSILLRMLAGLLLYLNKIATKTNFNINRIGTMITMNFKKPECRVECWVYGLIYQ